VTFDLEIGANCDQQWYSVLLPPHILSLVGGFNQKDIVKKVGSAVAVLAIAAGGITIATSGTDKDPVLPPSPNPLPKFRNRRLSSPTHPRQLNPPQPPQHRRRRPSDPPASRSPTVPTVHSRPTQL
jgi:hypothetical protein